MARAWPVADIVGHQLSRRVRSNSIVSGLTIRQIPRIGAKTFYRLVIRGAAIVETLGGILRRWKRPRVVSGRIHRKRHRRSADDDCG